MKNVAIRLNTPEDALAFVDKVCRYPFDVDMKGDHFKIDAKSIIGVIGLSVGKNVTLSMDAEGENRLLDDIAAYRVA